MTHTVRVYGSDEASEASESGVALLEEHDFTDLVTLNAMPKFAIKAAVHDWGYTYSGITAEEAQGIADTLTEGSGEKWTVEPISD